jgi:hypothetical protein
MLVKFGNNAFPICRPKALSERRCVSCNVRMQSPLRPSWPQAGPILIAPHPSFQTSTPPNLSRKPKVLPDKPMPLTPPNLPQTNQKQDPDETSRLTSSFRNISVRAQPSRAFSILIELMWWQPEFTLSSSSPVSLRVLRYDPAHVLIMLEEAVESTGFLRSRAPSGCG